MPPTKVVIIGGGVGGYATALRAAGLGADVTLVEKGRLGGVCLNRGCIPTKVLLHAAFLYHEMKRAQVFGLGASDIRFDFAQINARKNAIVQKLGQGVADLLRAKKARVVAGTARLDGPKKVVIAETGEALPADRIVVASGSVPAGSRWHESGAGRHQDGGRPHFNQWADADEFPTH